MKNRFNRNRVCSSDNYELSRKVHIQYLKEIHYKNIETLNQYLQVKTTKSFIQVFDTIIEITNTEASLISKTVTIIKK